MGTNSLRGQVGAVRRARALAARGWAPEAIERTAGIPAHQIRKALEHRHAVSAEALRAIAVIYDRLWDQAPPRRTEEDRQLAEAALEEARARHYPPPMAWDDDEIDNPDVHKPQGWQRTGKDVQVSYRDRLEDVAFLRDHAGYQHATDAELAMRLGIDRDTLQRALTRGRELQQLDTQFDREAG